MGEGGSRRWRWWWGWGCLFRRLRLLRRNLLHHQRPNRGWGKHPRRDARGRRWRRRRRWWWWRLRRGLFCWRRLPLLMSLPLPLLPLLLSLPLPLPSPLGLRLRLRFGRGRGVGTNRRARRLRRYALRDPGVEADQPGRHLAAKADRSRPGGRRGRGRVASAASLSMRLARGPPLGPGAAVDVGRTRFPHGHHRQFPGSSRSCRRGGAW